MLVRHLQSAWSFFSSRISVRYYVLFVKGFIVPNVRIQRRATVWPVRRNDLLGIYAAQFKCNFL
jgi:membrane protein YdbS with pleckstrin-like domain